MGYGGRGDWVNWSDEEIARRRGGEVKPPVMKKEKGKNHKKIQTLLKQIEKIKSQILELEE